MRLGGVDHDRERVFLLSTTHGAETHGLAAAIATMNVYKTEPVIDVAVAARAAPGRRPARGGARSRRGRSGADPRPAVLPGVRLARRRRPAVTGVPHAADAGGDPARRAGDLAGRQLQPHRVRHRPDHRGVCTAAFVIYRQALDDGVEAISSAVPSSPRCGPRLDCMSTPEATHQPEFWRGRRVFITGHTGFKGSWLCLWLAPSGRARQRLRAAATDRAVAVRTRRVAS
jgi:hypothetical protein